MAAGTRPVLPTWTRSHPGAAGSAPHPARIGLQPAFGVLAWSSANKTGFAPAISSAPQAGLKAPNCSRPWASVAYIGLEPTGCGRRKASTGIRPAIARPQFFLLS